MLNLSYTCNFHKISQYKTGLLLQSDMLCQQKVAMPTPIIVYNTVDTYHRHNYYSTHPQ